MRTRKQRRSDRFIYPELTEAQIERTCSDYLALDGWRMLKTNPVSDRSRGKGFGQKGMPDCLYIRYTPRVGGQNIPPGIHIEKSMPLNDWWRSTCQAELLWIEWKSAKGRIQSHQREWHCLERLRGAATWIAGQEFPATIEGFQAFYRKSGLWRTSDI